MTDEEYILLRKLREGDTGALDVLYLLYAPKVKDFALRFLKNATDAEDVTHDIFLRVWEERELVGRALSIRAYLFRMTRNAIFNTFRRRQLLYRYTQAATSGKLLQDLDERVTTDDLLKLIDLAIENLPEQRRRIFKMSRYEHMSYNDIAEALNISPKTVQYHISGALAELRKLLSSMLFFV